MTHAHYLDESLRDSTFLMTLPFDQNRLPRYMTDNVLSRVRQRWVWFSKAKELNPSLGTLSYFPAEIRSYIWKSLLQCKATLSADGIWEYDSVLGPPFQLASFYFGFGRRGYFLEAAEAARLVSSQIKAEYDHAFLYMRTFRFNNPGNVYKFLQRIGGDQLQQLSSMEFAICMYTQKCPLHFP